MFKSLKSKILAAAITAALALPSLVFGASVNLTLKDHVGNSLTNFAGVNVMVEDGFGAVMFNGAPTVNPMLVDGLAPYNNYSISVESTKTIAGKEVKTIAKKSLSFTSDEEVLSKDIYLINAKAENVLLRATAMPIAWTTANIVLTPTNTSTVRHNYSNIVVPIVPVNGAVDTVMTELPAGSFQWRIEGTGQNFAGKSNVFSKNNATLYMNAAAIIDNVISINFNLKNADRTPATFSGERFDVTIKNDKNETVMVGDSTPGEGSTVNLESNTLPQGSYTMVATMTKDGVVKTYNRNIYVGSTPKVVNINPVKVSFSDITFLVKNSRTGAPVATGTYTVKKKSDMSVLSTGSFNGGSFMKSLATGTAVVVEVEATGYSKRTFNITPSENASKELSMSASL